MSFTNRSRIKPQQYEAGTVRSYVLNPTETQLLTRSMQQPFPDRRYAMNNWPIADKRFYNEVDLAAGLKDRRKHPRPLLGRGVYIPNAMLISQEPIINLVEVTARAPTANMAYGKGYDEEEYSAIPNVFQAEDIKRQVVNGRQIASTRPDWNHTQLLRFIEENKDADHGVMVNREGLFGVEGVSKHLDREAIDKKVSLYGLLRPPLGHFVGGAKGQPETGNLLSIGGIA